MLTYIYDHPLLEQPLKIYYMYEYHSYYHFKHHIRVKNPDFNIIDRLILDLKKDSKRAIKFFSNNLIEIFDCLENLDKINFAAMPSHDENVSVTAMHLIAQKLAAHYDKPDYSQLIQRYKTIPRLSDGGIRNMGVHINSIRVNPNFVIKGQQIFLLDDITTSGSSMAAADQILKIAGAAKVTCLALSHKF